MPEATRRRDRKMESEQEEEKEAKGKRRGKCAHETILSEQECHLPASFPTATPKSTPLLSPGCALCGSSTGDWTSASAW